MFRNFSKRARPKHFFYIQPLQGVASFLQNKVPPSKTPRLPCSAPFQTVLSPVSCIHNHPFFLREKTVLPSTHTSINKLSEGTYQWLLLHLARPREKFRPSKDDFFNHFPDLQKTVETEGRGDSSVINKRQPTPTQTHVHIRQSHQHIKTSATP